MDENSRGFLAQDFFPLSLALYFSFNMLFFRRINVLEHLIVYCSVRGDGGNVKCENKIEIKHIYLHTRNEQRTTTNKKYGENDKRMKLVSGRISHQNQDTFHVINVDIGREHVNVRM